MTRVLKAKNGTYFILLGAAHNFAVRFKRSVDGINWESAIESFNIDNSFVRYQDGRGKIDGVQYSTESQWKIVSGLASSSAVSTGLDQQDATFYVK
jgi:shikimate kinase